MEDGSPPTVLQVYPVHGEKNIYYIRLRTTHYSFSIKSSCVTRSLDSFYQLRSMIQKHHTYLTIPSLPVQPSLWLSSYKTISTAIVTFVSEVLFWKHLQLLAFLLTSFQVLQCRELLSNKAIHLFLQTQLSIDDIRDNMEGKRDDDVALTVAEIVKDDRKVSRQGFGQLFGDET